MKMLTALSFGMGTGPRVEIFTEIICREYYHDRLGDDSFGSPFGGLLSPVQVCFTKSDCSWH